MRYGLWGNGVLSYLMRGVCIGLNIVLALYLYFWKMVEVDSAVDLGVVIHQGVEEMMWLGVVEVC